MDPRACRRILEVPDDASMEDIAQRIYENDRAVYAAPSMDEFSPQAREEVLAEIEAAYRELVRLHAEAQPQVHIVPVALPERDRPIDGRTLQSLRESQGITLDYVSSQTHVRLEHLQALEEERFWDLPPAAVNVRGFLSAYASEVGLPVDEVVPPYMERFLKWQARRVK